MADKSKIIADDKAWCSGVPADAEQRRRLRLLAEDFVREQGLVPPVPLEMLKHSARTILAGAELDPEYLPFTIVLLNNALWRDRLVKVPFDKRLLLLPQCLKHSSQCPAAIDSLGLICKHCGRCVIDRLVHRAEQLGYAVLVAEGSPVVMAMIESGQIQATVGVSCLSVLERVFPYMEAAAVPGIAIPLLKDGCKDTVFDDDWLLEVLEAYEDLPQKSADLSRLKHTVQVWFESQALSMYFADDGQAATLAQEWMLLEGKRYRPMLAAGVYAALTATVVEEIGPTVQQAAVAVECFHKASLIHDDIEDGDSRRYEQETLHLRYGVPVALNTGDYLVGLGYELLAHLDCPDTQKAKILQAASEGHRQLCRGQGAELESMAAGQLLPVEDMIEIFAQKTSPAFAVALKVGAILAGADAAMLGALDAYSRTLGIAYQIRDDLHDHQSGQMDKAFSIIASMAAVDGDEQEAVRRTRQLLEDYRRQAIESLEAIKQSDCKAFLRKVITKLFDGDEPMGCCDDDTSKPD